MKTLKYLNKDFKIEVFKLILIALFLYMSITLIMIYMKRTYIEFSILYFIIFTLGYVVFLKRKSHYDTLKPKPSSSGERLKFLQDYYFESRGRMITFIVLAGLSIANISYYFLNYMPNVFYLVILNLLLLFYFRALQLTTEATSYARKCYQIAKDPFQFL